MPKTQHHHYRICSCFLQQTGSPLLSRGKKPVISQKNVHHSEGARMHPGVDTPVSLISYNHFNILSEECLFSLSLSPISSSSRKHSRHHLHFQSDLRSALRISRLAVFGSSSFSCSSSLSDTDLRSEDPLTLAITVNNSLSASLLIDSGASSQFIDVDYAEHMNLEMTLKPESQDLILADGKPSPNR